MRSLSTLMVMAALTTATASATTVNFDDLATGAPPAGWTATQTGSGSAKWSVENDDSAPSKPNVLEQSGEATFPVCMKDDTQIKDGFVEVKFKPMQGSEDRAGGLMWRLKDGDNYYVARANALENNVSVYYTTRGSRHTIKYVDAPVAANQWHTLRVEFTGSHFKVSLDGKLYIDQEDDHLSGSGSIGVWTKADSVTSFDDFSWAGK